MDAVQMRCIAQLCCDRVDHLLCRYNEYHKCVADPAKTEQDCSFFQRAYRAMCPNEWVSASVCWLKGLLCSTGLHGFPVD